MKAIQDLKHKGVTKEQLLKAIDSLYNKSPLKYRTVKESFWFEEPHNSPNVDYVFKKKQFEEIFMEDYGFGFHAIFKTSSTWTDFEVYEIISKDDKGANYYEESEKFNKSLSVEQTSDLKKASHYLKGFLKWDGCTEFNLGESATHMCGADEDRPKCNGIKKHIAMLEYIYERAFEIQVLVKDEEVEIK